MKGYNSDYGGGGSSSSSSSPVKGKDYNTAGSSSVGKVDSVSIVADAHGLPKEDTGNSVTKSYKDGKLDQERYYGDDGKPYLDIDYSNHGNPKMHPKVPQKSKVEDWK
ncbi:hypothetical protein [Lachnobacterium bovis]|uniref:hypothetical protein n=1 Tax=Lachnobacterium bovis TaxID=140626 RepID=UPI0004916855|nr:hypothetical protein [Lachnobacterium bovis]